MKRSVILAAVVSVMCVIPLRAGDYGAVKDEQAFRRELMVKTSAVTSIQASFVQEKFLSVFSSTVKSEGKFYWEKEDKICLDGPDECTHNFLHDREFECDGRRIQDIGPGIGS